MKPISLWMAAAALVFQAASADAACHAEGSVDIYDGTIGKAAVRVALQIKNGQVRGKYVHRISQSDLPLKGTLDSSGRHLSLTEFDSAGHPTAKFAGTFADRDAKFANGSPLNCEVVSGTWTASGKAPMNFKLSMSSSGPADLAHLYDAAGVSNDEVVNKAATSFREAVMHNRKDAVAKMIDYPIETSVNGKRTRIANAYALIAHYDGIFTPAFRATIEGDFTRLMFARGQGVMMGGGEVWFGPTGKVIALNN
ncbi:MAG TPA: hypothetical protein VGM17_03585 [Rhizomicrobium sp.]|jgi:hypothetical protein